MPNKDLHKYPIEKTIFYLFAKKFPKATIFILERTRLDKFRGLPLTILFFLLLLTLSLFADTAENIRELDTIVHIDKSFSYFLFALRTPALNRFFYVFTQIGSPYGTLTILSSFCLVCLWRKHYRYLLSLLIIIIGMGASVYFSKLILHRERPEFIAFYHETGFSFPSGHSASIMCLYGYFTFFLIEITQKHYLHVIISTLSFILIILVGFSRIYLGVHYLSDVLGGYLLGIFWMLFGIILTLWMKEAKTNKNKNELL